MQRFENAMERLMRVCLGCHYLNRYIAVTLSLHYRYITLQVRVCLGCHYLNLTLPLHYRHIAVTLPLALQVPQARLGLPRGGKQRAVPLRPAMLTRACDGSVTVL